MSITNLKLEADKNWNHDMPVAGSEYHMLWCSQHWNMWVFPKIEVPQNGWFRMEKLIKMDDLEVPLFLETPN